MALNRNKVTAAAQKYIQKGAYKKAIKEYKKIIMEHPDDVRVLLKIGDIQARDGQSETAARTYNEVADHYVAHGFFLKAVAAYKLLLGVEPGNVEAKLRLADLYFQLGLLRDALANYQAVAAVFNERGWIDRYLQTLQKVVDIDPDHAGNRIKYAEELARFDHEVGAAEQFMIAAAALRREGRFEDFTKVMERYIHLSPADLKAVHDICRIYLQQNRPKRALVRIQEAFKADPADETTVDILVKALDAMGERDRAVGVLKELAASYTANGSKRSADATYRRVLELAPDDPDATSALGIAPAGGAPGAGAPLMTFDVVEPGPAAGQPAPIEVDEGEVEKLLSETDVYLKYNLHDKALEHLQKVFELDPQNVEGMERRKTALIATGQHGLAVSVLIGLARIVHPSDDQRAIAYLHEALSIAPGDPAVIQVMSELSGVAPEADQHVTEAVVAEPTPLPTVEDASFDRLDELFDEFAKEDTAAGHKTLSEEFTKGDAQDEPADVITLGADEILPAELDEGLEEAEALLAAGDVEDARMLLFELLGDFPEHAEMLLRRMDELPQSEPEPEPEPEPVAETTVGAADDLFLSDSTFPSEEAEVALGDGVPPVAPPKLPGAEPPIMEFEAADPDSAASTNDESFEFVSDEVPTEETAIEFVLEDDREEEDTIEFAPQDDEQPAGEAIEFAVAEEPASGESVDDAAESLPDVSHATPGSPRAESSLELPRMRHESNSGDDRAVSSGGTRRVLVPPPPASLSGESPVFAAAPSEIAAREAATDAVAAALEGDGLAVSEDAIAEAEMRKSGDFVVVQELTEATDVDTTADAGTVDVAVVSNDEDGVSADAEGTGPEPAVRGVEGAEVEESDEGEAAEDDSEADNTEATEGDAKTEEDAAAEGAEAPVESSVEELQRADAVDFDGDEMEIEVELDDLDDVDQLDALDELDEIEISDFGDDDDEVEFEDIDESDFEDAAAPDAADDADRAEDAAYAAEARENEVDAPIGRGSSFVTLTFGPADAVVADDGGSGVGAAIEMRRSGEGMAAIFELQAATDGKYALAAGFELALANIEMGLYFEGTSTLEQLLGNMDIERNDQLLVHYHLGIAYEAMDQQQLAEANFRVVATSAPEMFPDVFLRLERMSN